ncbi:MAG TPA: GIY-YIG nuclease family protein [Cyclobacteriaceae bacterium]
MRNYMKAHMYILECADGSLYTGSTTNLELRIEEHQNGQGAKSHKETIACEAGVL